MKKILNKKVNEIIPSLLGGLPLDNYRNPATRPFYPKEETEEERKTRMSKEYEKANIAQRFRPGKYGLLITFLSVIATFVIAGTWSQFSAAMNAATIVSSVLLLAGSIFFAITRVFAFDEELDDLKSKR